MRPLAFLMVVTLMGACVLEDEPINGAGGTAGFGGTGGSGGECGSCSGDRPVCNEDTGLCVQCTTADAGACTDDTPVCNPDTNECVACLTSANCTMPDAARCNTQTNQCVACQSPLDCEDVPNAPLCNEGTCVECTPENENEDCAGNTCNPATLRCTDTEIGSRGTCETCVTDTDCGQPDNRCIAMRYQGTAFPNDETGFCLKTTAGGCEQPFSITLEDGVSFSGGPEDDYCGINQDLATCPAVLALIDNERCDGGEDSECPQPSGLCRQVGALSNRCTYECALPVQCPSASPADTCGSSGSGSEDYCGG